MRTKERSLSAKKKKTSSRGNVQNTVTLREISAKTHLLQLWQCRGSRATKQGDCD